MNRTSAIQLFISIFLLAASGKANTADSLSGKYPGMVLIQLKSENNRIQALTKARRFKDLEQVLNDANSSAAAMINDFRDHFNYCPVYYFIDTNLDLVKQKKFDRVLLNADRSPVENPSINSASENYVIVFFGYAVMQKRSEKVVKDPARYQSGAEQPAGKGLVINNHKYEQVGYINKKQYLDLLESKKDKEKEKLYKYSSPRFEIEYYPLAGSFNEKLKQRTIKK